MEQTFNTEFPPHSTQSGRVPKGYPGPIPEHPVEAARQNDSDNSSKEESKSGSGSDPDVVNPNALDATGDGTPDDHGNVAPPPTLAAWAARIITLGIMTLIIGYLVHLCLRPTVPAQFEVESAFDAVELRGGNWVLPVSVTNTSTESMGAVTVEVVQGETTRSFQFTLMGEGERGEAEVVFAERPTADTIEVTVVSYVSP